MSHDQKKDCKLFLILVLIGICCFISIYFHLLGICIIYTHLFYVPIILAGIWWRRKGLVVAIFLAVILIIIHLLTMGMEDIVPEFSRTLIFIVIALVTAILSERIAKTEEVLRESEERYRYVVENANEAIFVAQDGMLTFVNPQSVEMTGYSEEELTSIPFKEFIHPEDRDMVFERHLKRLTGEELPHVYPFRIIDKGGDTKWVELDAVRVIWNGKPATLNFMSGITERMQMEEMLRASEKQLKETNDYLDNIIKSSADAIVVVDMEGIVRAWNRGAEDYMGYTADEVIGTPNKNFFADPEEADRIMKIVLRGGMLKNHRATVLNKDKKPVHINMSAALLRDKDGVPIGTVRVSRDITKEAELEARIKDERDKSNLIFETIPDGVYIVSPDYEVQFMNQVLIDTFGDCIGGICYKAFHNREEPCPRCKNAEVMQGKTVRWEWHSHRMNRTYDLIEMPLRFSDDTISKLTIFRDITERKRVEMERERLLRELEAKSAEMERFTYTVSHDLRSPLYAIQGFTNLAREDLEQGKLENVASELERTENAATKMDRLLNDTLQLSRIGRVANPPEDVPFGEIVEEALEQTAEHIKSSGAKISTANDFPTVHVDKMRIVEILVNLITNSIKYRDEQQNPQIEIGYRVEGGDTIFFVKDNGMGIDPSQHEKVFELFYQVDRSGNGTGAGLAIVKRIIEVHGGRIWLESEKGKGCTVCFTLIVA